MKVKLQLLIYQLLQFVVNIFPDIFIGDRVRAIFYKLYFKQIGKKCRFGHKCYFEVPENIQMGNNSSFNKDCWVSGGGGLNIGNNVLIGPKVIIHSANHNYCKMDQLIINQGHTFKHVNIGNDVWIGAGVIVLPGVTIENGCVIGAGSVVTKNIPSYSVAVGNPAKVVKEREA